MSRLLSPFSTVSLLLILCPFAALATPVIVPDQYATIQAAIDAGETEIQVKDGLPPEQVMIKGSVTIEAWNGWRSGFGTTWSDQPSLASVDKPTTSESWDVKVIGVRFLRPVNFSMSNGALLFEACRFDSGLVAPDHRTLGTIASVRNCMIIGGCRVESAYTQFSGNTVIGGTAIVWSDGNHDVRNNYCIGPASAGLDLSLRDSAGPISGNTVRGTTDGIRVPGHSSPVHFNDVSDCTGDGIVLTDELESACDSNRISHCSGNGIAVYPRSTYQPVVPIRGNVIRGSGKDGVHLEHASSAPFAGNVILDSGGDGVVTTYQGSFRTGIEGVAGNVIGRSGGAGIRVPGLPGDMFNNTIFANGGAGIEAQDGSWGHVNHNIFAFNEGPGLLNSGGHHPFSNCNDWFENGAPPVGVELEQTDWSLDPLFCDRSTGDGHVASNSPLLNMGFCGLVGAFGAGCPGSVTGVEPADEGRAKGFSASPIPARAAVQFAIPSSDAPTRLEVFDVSGARRWSCRVSARSESQWWNLQQDDGAPVPPGVYFARIQQGEREVARTRLVVSR